jgi:hypothetical protein
LHAIAENSFKFFAKIFIKVFGIRVDFGNQPQIMVFSTSPGVRVAQNQHRRTASVSVNQTVKITWTFHGYIHSKSKSLWKTLTFTEGEESLDEIRKEIESTGVSDEQIDKYVDLIHKWLIQKVETLDF